MSKGSGTDHSRGRLTRREWLGVSGAAGLWAAAGGRVALGLDAHAPPPRPTPAQLAWQEAGLGALLSYDLHVFDGMRYEPGEVRQKPAADIQMFSPPAYDMAQWVEAAQGMGARFAILTASHETGFRLWQSDANPYCMKALCWKDGKGDLVKDFVEACLKAGIQPGIRLGARWNSQLGVLDFRVQPESKITQAEYNRLIERETEEICTRYGPLFQLWFDGGIPAPQQGGPGILPILERHQPDCLFCHSAERADVRWVGTENGIVTDPCWATMPERGSALHRDLDLAMRGDPNGAFWQPAMAISPLRGVNGRHEWFWEPGDESAIQPLDALQVMYYQSVGRNATLILGITPDTRGLIPAPDAARLRDFGTWIRGQFGGKPLGRTQGNGAFLQLRFEQPQNVTHIILQEDIRQGERVRQYVVEGVRPDGSSVELFRGENIGCRRILVVKPAQMSGLRLGIPRSMGEPRIKLFEARS